MSYTVSWTVKAEQDLDGLDEEVAERIVTKMDAVSDYPFHFLEMLKGYPYHRLRVGDYRAVVDVDREEERLTVILVGHRDKVYQEMGRRS
ncbi:MAG: type II toxin-antitoxin system RelE/ParE family toxin [Candidatus Nanohaloarchaea archaeon]|nr:type II toxin-antitoxin system RelE/ParE family toxin [Candidatus Nanohaloarchaea archaeon]